MTVPEPVRWGRAPTPLLPSLLAEEAADIPLVRPLPGFDGCDTVGDVTERWRTRSPLLTPRMLVAVRRWRLTLPDLRFDHVVCDSPQRLVGYPLRASTRAAVAAAVRSGRIPPDRPVTVGGLTWVRDLGKSRVLDLVCVAEADPHNNPNPDTGVDDRDVGDVWDGWVAAMTGLEKDVLRHRVAAVDGWSYQQLGDRWDVTREHARQTAVAVAAQLGPGGVAYPVGAVAEQAAAELAGSGPFSPEAGEALEPARRLVGDVPWAGLVAACDPPTRAAEAGRLLRAHVAPSVGRVAEAVDDALLDGWCGLVDSRRLAALIDPAAAAYQDTVFGLAGLVKVGDRWATAATNTTRVAAVLHDADAPLSTDRVVALSGVKQPQHALRVLSDVVARAGFRLWWRADRVDEPYEGAPRTVARMIERSPDGAVPADAVVERLVSLGLSHTSALKAIRADRFRRGADGRVRLVPFDEIAAFRADEGPADGHRQDGTPFWTVTVTAPHLRGYSLQLVPHGLGQAAGVTPGETVHLDVTEPAGCGPVTVTWPLGYATGCVVGHVRVPFRRLGLTEGDMCDIAVAAGKVRFMARTGDRPPRPKAEPKRWIALKPCGTASAYRRHLRRGEKTCGPCRQAWNEYRNPGRVVKQRGGLKPCGTIAAYRRHLHRGEKTCGPCRQAWNEYRNPSRVAKV